MEMNRYCVNCGSPMNEGTYCNACGQGTGNARSHATERNVGLSILLSLLWAGAGLIYAGKMTKGFVTMAAFIIGAAVGFLFLGFLGLIIPAVIYIWSIAETYSIVNEYNRILSETGSAPW